MALKLYLFSLVSTFLLSLFLFFLLFFSVDPYQAPSWIIFLFYVTFFLIWTTIFAITGLYLKIWVSNHEVIFAHITPTLRQGALGGLTITVLLFLKQIGVLNWWITALVIIASILIELFFRSRK